MLGEAEPYKDTRVITNLEVKVGGRDTKSKADDSVPSAASILGGNERYRKRLNDFNVIIRKV